MGHDAGAAGAPKEIVRLFTDGACSGNPGPGGWAFILEHPASGHTIDCSGAEPNTTNNRMELTGVIEGLSSLKRPCQVELVTDSQYVAKGIRTGCRCGNARDGNGKRGVRSSRCQTSTFGSRSTRSWPCTTFE